MSETLSKSALIGNRVSIKQMAAALNHKTPKTVMKTIRRHCIPYVVIGRLVHVDPAAFREAIERDMVSTAPRGRGRPRNTATPKQ